MYKGYLLNLRRVALGRQAKCGPMKKSPHPIAISLIPSQGGPRQTGPALGGGSLFFLTKSGLDLDG